MLEKKNGEEVGDVGDYGYIPLSPFAANKPVSIEDVMRDVYSQNASDATSIEKSRYTTLFIRGAVVAAAGVASSIALLRFAHRH